MRLSIGKLATVLLGIALRSAECHFTDALHVTVSVFNPYLVCVSLFADGPRFYWCDYESASTNEHYYSKGRNRSSPLTKRGP